MAVRAGFRSRGRKHWVFAHEDAQVGVLAQLRGLATRGSAPSAALGRLEDGAPASRDRLRSGNCLIKTATARTHDICHGQVMTLCIVAARKPEV